MASLSGLNGAIMTDSELKQLSEQVGLALKARGATVTTAESCTGGWVAKVLTDIAGSSAWFERGFVTYSNEAKSQMIGVSEDAPRPWRGERAGGG
jgi:nicotinamide-nucleotide amidase